MTGNLSGQLVLFTRMLRGLKIDVTPEQAGALTAALKYIDLRQREDFKAAARAILVHHYEHLPLFNVAFDLFWRDREAHPLPKQPRSWPVRRERRTMQMASKYAPLSEKNENKEETTYSAAEKLRLKDFAHLNEEELRQVKRLIEGLVWNLEQRRTRRRVRASHGEMVDMRRTFRQSLRTGAQPMRLYWRRRKHKRRPIVVICDISGSMERYSRILLQFIYAISNRLEKVEAFAFSTRLTHITRQLHRRDVEAALNDVTRSIHDWGGGTRIGEALKIFNYHWARRVLGQGAMVLIISDGWDRGDASLLAEEMARLQRSAHRLIWLSPLLGSPHYEPLTRGIQAALPYIDDFLSAQNLASLEQLGSLMERLGEHRPLRRQTTRPVETDTL